MCMISAMSPMQASNTPTVLGLVSIRAAVWLSTFLFRSSRSTRPSGRELTVIACRPQTAQLAGLVPWAESGVRTFGRDSPRER